MLFKYCLNKNLRIFQIQIRGQKMYFQSELFTFKNYMQTIEHAGLLFGANSFAIFFGWMDEWSGTSGIMLFKERRFFMKQLDMQKSYGYKWKFT